MKSSVLFAVFLAVCASDVLAAESTQIVIQKFAFAPKEITVAPGTTVVWINRDETPHTVKASDGSFVSKALDTEDKFERTFDKEGDYNYFCTLHPFMTGIVHVHGGTKPAGGGSGGG